MTIQIQEIPIGHNIPCTYHLDADEMCGKPSVELLVAWSLTKVETIGSFCQEHADEDTTVHDYWAERSEWLKENLNEQE